MLLEHILIALVAKQKRNEDKGFTEKDLASFLATKDELRAVLMAERVIKPARVQFDRTNRDGESAFEEFEEGVKKLIDKDFAFAKLSFPQKETQKEEETRAEEIQTHVIDILKNYVGQLWILKTPSVKVVRLGKQFEDKEAKPTPRELKEFERR